MTDPASCAICGRAIFGPPPDFKPSGALAPYGDRIVHIRCLSRRRP